MTTDEATTTDASTSPEASARPRPRLITVAASVVVALVPLVLLRQLLRPINDPDTYWHILSGQNVWRTHEVVVSDPFGRFSENPWVQIDWLSDLAMAAAYHVAGFSGVAWLYISLGVVLFAVIYASCRTVAVPVVAGIAAVGGWVGTYASQGFRPQTFSFVLLAVTLLVWELVRRDQRTRLAWWLVPLGYLWACLHGLWVLGPIVGAAVVLGMAWDRVLPWRRLGLLALVPVAEVAVAAATPIGPRLLLAPFTVNGYARLVTEWRPPDVHEVYVAVTVMLVAVTAVAWARSEKRPSGAELLLWLMALGWTLLYSRTVAVGAVIAAPLAARAITSLLRVPPDRAAGRADRFVVPAGALVGILAAALLAPSQASGLGNVPTSLETAIDRLPADTVVVNDDGLGGWLLLEHPQVHPVLDTRTYLFTVPYIESYIQFRGALGDWQGFVRRTGATAALLREGEPVLGELTGTLGWTEVGRGEGYVLLTAPGTGR
ncbi:hypothetical protein [Phycicoccus flavus]|uniref:hypothetical protein n=1 Tax=Phycicoccus flavus TaxID=2502783 RepID=UPI000FEBEBC2|nr:hypothetical protein [Phycicoccus flavus]NHA69163.1 hypothetical protein [Phycicoccus flavus]